MGLEILRQSGGELDAIFVPVGGGGLIGGVAVFVKSLYPQVKVIGVEPEDAAAMYESLRAGARVTLERVGIFADGVAVNASARSALPSHASTSMRSCSSIRMRSARPFRMCSRTPARSSSPPVHSPWPASKSM